MTFYELQTPYSVPGYATDTSITIASGVPKATEILPLFLLYSTANRGDGFPAAPFSGSVVATHADDLNIVKHRPVRLAPDQVYFAGLSRTSNGEQFLGEPIRFRTRPSPDDFSAKDIKWAYGSCQIDYDNPKGPHDETGRLLEDSWIDVLQFAPDILWDTGDFHYNGGGGNKFGGVEQWQTWAGMYQRQLDGMDKMRAARACCVHDIIADDHEISSNNGDSFFDPLSDPLETKTGLNRNYQMLGMSRLFGMYPLAEPNVDFVQRGLHGTYLLTPRVRIINVDVFSLARSKGQDDDDLRKSYLGPAQTDWLKETLKLGAVLNIVMCGKAYIGPTIPKPVGGWDQAEQDKVWVYGTWRNEFVHWLNQPEQADVNLVWMGGDRHAMGYCHGSNNPWGRFPVWMGSGWGHVGNGQKPGELYRGLDGTDNSYGWTAQELPYVMQYIRGHIVDDGNGTITLAGEGRYHDPQDRTMKTRFAFSDDWHYLP